ncbi:MAG TPA: HAMP domain-containing sensor histidine kinase [Polyangiaceae bacterium]
MERSSASLGCGGDAFVEPSPITRGPAIPARVSDAELKAQVDALTSQSLVQALLDATNTCVCVLNRQRQVVFGNSALRTFVGSESVDALFGKRPGEALGCVHASLAPSGCGTSPECGTCGAAHAILECQRTGGTVERECLIAVLRDSASTTLEVRIRASQLVLNGDRYTIVGLSDIGAEKQRDALERVFLHDLANILSPLLAWSEVLAARDLGESSNIMQRIALLAGRLRIEIEQQRMLLQAERGTLVAKPEAVEPSTVCDAALRVVEGYSESRTKTLEQRRQGAAFGPIFCDEALLTRVLVNMLKNAIEATPPGELVRLELSEEPDSCEFRVWNVGAMPMPVAQQVFKRSFSTKGERGRGLGTFSMKLLGERYLRGKVGFTSSEQDGTTFFIRVPRTPDPR